VDKGVGHSSRTKVNRLINFPVFAFLSLMALLFLFSSRLSHLSVPHAMLESGKAIDRAAVEKATLINPNAVGLFTDPAGIKVPMIDQRVDFSVGTPLKEVMRKLRVVPSHPKDHVHSRFDVKTGYGAKPAANPATRRSNSHPAGFFLGLEHQFAAFASRLQFTGAAGRFVHKDALVAQTNGRRRKEMRINERRIRSWLTSSFRPARSMASVLGPGRVGIVPHDR
jgi:hypothetical protein